MNRILFRRGLEGISEIFRADKGRGRFTSFDLDTFLWNFVIKFIFIFLTLGNPYIKQNIVMTVVIYFFLNIYNCSNINKQTNKRGLYMTYQEYEDWLYNQLIAMTNSSPQLRDEELGK